jgi:probable DNA repair protein
MYDWLPDALEGDATVITANRRLARVLQQEFAQRQVAAGIGAWRSPRILAWADWLDAILKDARGQEKLPTRINHYHSALLWDRCLRKELGEDKGSLSMLVRLARDSWQRLSDWNITIKDVARAAHSADHKTFAAAAGRYLGVLERNAWVDEAGLAGLVRALIGAHRIAVQGRFTFAGFDREKPTVSSIRECLVVAGCEVQDAPQGKRQGAPLLYAFDSAEAQLRAAGAWARKRLEENPAERIAIVVNGLERDAPRVAGLVREGLIPGYRLSADVPAGALNVSYGRKLANHALVSIGLLWLRWIVCDLRSIDVCQLLRSPLLGTPATAGRPRLELRMRGFPDRDWSPSMVTSVLQSKEEEADAVDWLRRVATLTKLRRELPKSASPGEWAVRIDEILTKSGWPGQGALESADFQLVNRWRDLLNDLARMELVTASLPLESALNQLERMAADAVFQPESDIAQVHLLGPLEASGLEFDALFLTGMTAADWPSRSNPSVLVARSLQVKNGMPDAVPADRVAYARRLLSHLCDAAPVVACSYAVINDDAEQAPSQLLDELGVVERTAPPDPGWHAASLPGSTSVDTAADTVPGIDGEERLFGGAGTIQNQLTNPVAAFLGGRLGVRPLDEQARGLPALLRGNLIHDALYKLYFDRPSRTEVSAWQDVAERIGKAIDFAFTKHERYADSVLRRLFAMERMRVAGLLQEFLVLDTARDEFIVAGVERKVEFVEAGVRLELRIDRVDRVEDGRIVIIDYKTGAEKKFLTSKGEPREFQLVAYACAVDEPVAALVLANVDSRVIGFHGAGSGFTDIDTWPDQLDKWSRIVRDACAEIARGDVRINRYQNAPDARPLNLLTRFTELRNDW